MSHVRRTFVHMSAPGTFVEAERRRAVRWKATSPSLPSEARQPGPYLRDGRAVGWYEYCLPPTYAQWNLLPGAREGALQYFAEAALVWHQATPAGPTNHLLSSQVQCVNALEGAANDPARLQRALGHELDLAEPMEIEAERFVAFEYIGEVDHLGEARRGVRQRGSMATSADAAIRYRNSSGQVEVALIEWKYTESYAGQELKSSTRGDRRDRYRQIWEDQSHHCRRDVLPYEDLFVEPFYQLMRQQLLAWRMEDSRELDAAIVRVIHVSPSGNAALRGSLNRPSHRLVGDDVFDIWRSIVGEKRFTTVDSAVFLDPDVSSAEYMARYGTQSPA